TCTNAGGTSTTSVTITFDGMLYKGCGRMLMSGALRGTITPRTPIAVPEGSELLVQIMSDPTESHESRILAEATTAVHGEGPFPFNIGYDPLRFHGGDRYVVRAEIRIKSQPQWVTPSMPLVFTWGNIGNVQVVVEPVRR